MRIERFTFLTEPRQGVRLDVSDLRHIQLSSVLLLLTIWREHKAVGIFLYPVAPALSLSHTRLALLLLPHKTPSVNWSSRALESGCWSDGMSSLSHISESLRPVCPGLSLACRSLSLSLAGLVGSTTSHPLWVVNSSFIDPYLATMRSFTGRKHLPVFLRTSLCSMSSTFPFHLETKALLNDNAVPMLVSLDCDCWFFWFTASVSACGRGADNYRCVRNGLQ